MPRATCTVSTHARSLPAPHNRTPEYAATHLALIQDVRQRRARAAQERFDAAMERMAGELTDALEHALRGEMEAG